MLRLCLTRCLAGIPALLLVTVLVFTVVRLIPGDPARILAGDFATDQAVAELRQRWRLDRPLPVQYAAYVAGLARGDLGRSTATSLPVAGELGERFLRTLLLAGAAILVATLVGVTLGILSATHRASLLDFVATALALAGVSTPIFWSGLILILLFSVELPWLPAGGTGSFAHLILPAVSLGLFGAGVIARQTRSSMLETLGEDFVRTARAKGLTERIVVYKHALKNALIPVVTVLADQFGRMLGGAILTETVFSWPGMGRYLIEAIAMRDYPVIQGIILVFATSFLVVNLLLDISYALLDPRVQPE
ncbi:MAG TPA: ABC transporter permease [Methylomirabilota bacterium]|jgi:ABC-type dipeptide/oligopeptide/nickel transport system permease component|nr:ABC transporter permease [Candidatus Dormibacteraeota bacterium]HWO05585.1 ABC transporter permease [Methylomirabilota bacterium]